jgi:hypothetical protein
MRGGLEVADVFREGGSCFLAQYGRTLSWEQRRVLRDVTCCRTAALGGHLQRCEDCGHERIQYNSCRNRHCPKCQALARAAWLEKREGELLPVPYFHVVFTLPHELAPLVLQNKRVIYDILFRAAAQTLLEIAADPKHLGAQIGCLMVLHTWGQNLMHHPHVHASVTGGGLAPDGQRWIGCKKSRTGKEFFLPVRVLSRLFRGKFLHGLKRAFARGALQFSGQRESLADSHQFQKLLNQSVRSEWTVYAKRPFGGPRQVLKYLARYTHRVAISNRRLVELRDGRVSFRYKDYADRQQSKILTLATPEFIRRFLMHTLPRGFVRIRYYGFLANRDRQQRLDQCRRLLGDPDQRAHQSDQITPSTQDAEQPSPTKTCPNCKRGTLVIVELMPLVPPLPPRRPFVLTRRVPHLVGLDTS